MKRFFSLFALAVFIQISTGAQAVSQMTVKDFRVLSFPGIEPPPARFNWPLVSFEINNQPFFADKDNEQIRLHLVDTGKFSPGIRLRVEFENISNDTLVLRNVVPLGIDSNAVYITGKGDHGLSRTHVFVPGYAPVNCIVPDNAWELGFSARTTGNNLSICALVRRDRSTLFNGRLSRFETTLYPGGRISYWFYADTFSGAWQEGLRKIFQDRHLYDVAAFDNSLFERPDLEWIRRSYVMHLKMAWDRDYYDAETREFGLTGFINRGKKLYGGDDAIGLWPTWPMLGLDERNQFDMFRDLPGGLPALRRQVSDMHKLGTRLLIAYNPWDESTRKEDQVKGLAAILEGTGADGAILDTRGASSRELQDAADRVKPGMVMYSEGMAVPKDMQGIVSGRVHNALYYPPLLSLNKFIKPEFAIFRVAELYKEPIQREYATSFFNGYGTELNVFAPGNPEWVEEQYRFLGKTTRILRENTAQFTSRKFTPLIPALVDSIYVNQWMEGDKTVYTLFSLHPAGFTGPLFRVDPVAGKHFVDVWHHEEIRPVSTDQGYYLPAKLDGFSARYLGTNNEGMVDCVVEFPELLRVNVAGEEIAVTAPAGDSILFWAGNPAYDKNPISFSKLSVQTTIQKIRGYGDDKIVIQLMGDGGQLLDERVIAFTAGSPWRISKKTTTPKASGHEAAMVKIPPGAFIFKTTNGDEFIPYPKSQENDTITLPAFMMDKYPVTNREFHRFIQATNYRPRDSANFLKHWENGRPAAGRENFPVVYVSLEDAQAYAKWAEKRLPTEAEWQYAAQAGDARSWPWSGNTPEIKRQEEPVTSTLTVFRIKGIDSSLANLAERPYAVGSFPNGANPHGLQDLTGSVWQLTGDVYQTGNYRYIMLKGGSWFNPSSSWWYIQGGPRELHYRQYLLRVSPGFERNATVGFRCVKDLE